MSIRSEFEEMVNASGRSEVLQFEDGISPLLKRYADAPEVQRWPELIEYLSTSLPKSDYHSHDWTFHCAEALVDLVPDNGMFDCGYFCFAYSNALFATVSLQDGRIYEMHIPEDEPWVVADSLTEFILLRRDEWIAYNKGDVGKET